MYVFGDLVPPNEPELMEIPHAQQVLVKMAEGMENGLSKNFPDNELRRVFKHLAGPAACLKIAKALIASGLEADQIPSLITRGKPLYAEATIMDELWKTAA